MNNMIGDRIKTRRKELNITPTQIHKEAHISTGNLSGIETGKSLPSASALISLSKILNCTTDWILKGETPNSEFSCISDNREQFLLTGFRTLNEDDKNELIGILNIKLEKYTDIKRAPKEMVKSTTSMTSEESATIEKMA